MRPIVSIYCFICLSRPYIVLSRPVGLDFPIEAGFHFSDFFPSPNPSENFWDAIIWYYSIYSRLIYSRFHRAWRLHHQKDLEPNLVLSQISSNFKIIFHALP
jgi:hypothetical protein